MGPVLRELLNGLLLLAAGSAFVSVFASEHAASLADCADIEADDKRLACFDRLAERTLGTKARPPAQPAAAQPSSAGSQADYLARHWEVDPAYKQGLFVFRPHQENYVLVANYLSDPNEAPFFRGLAPEVQDLSHIEVKYQLGFKLKMLQDISRLNADLWFGYTQQSNWQAYNERASSPFRDTSYQPELMAVVPVDFRLGRLHARFANIGLVHQSNGQTLSLSRSWDRVYVQLGMESGPLMLLARIWKRIDSVESDDDNPDITDYVGRGDIEARYLWKGHEFSVYARRNFNTHRGALRLGWAFPLAVRLKGYVQAFSGYGQSLIDYNYSQTTVGIGIMISD